MANMVNISKSMVIHGDIETTDDLVVEGAVVGKISYGQDLLVCGMVKGDVASFAENDSRIELSEGAIVIGDIMGNEIYFAGAGEGNVNARTQLHVLSTAKIKGDIDAARMDVENGAAIEGKMKINPDGKDLNQFFE